MKSKETLTIYWGSLSYDPNASSWAMLYRSPESLNKVLRENKSNFSGGMFLCPATNDFAKNMFVFRSNLDDIHILPTADLASMALLEPRGTFDLIDTGGKISLLKPRPSSFDGYINLTYNMSWALFAEENVNVRFTPPYLPPFSPAQGAFLAAGEFDIGQWYRPYNLDYHIPVTTETLEFKVEDPFFYMEVKTNKKVEFKRYISSPKLEALALEAKDSPNQYGRLQSLKERYVMAKNSGIREQILTEIKKNLVE
jgi:hypothetical protein